MNCRGAGIFSLLVVHHPGRIWYVHSGKAALKAMLQQNRSLLLCTIVMPSLGCVEGWDAQCGVSSVPAPSYLLQVMKGS